jgi:hypothetical protein
VRLEARSDSTATRHRGRSRPNGQGRQATPDPFGRLVWREHIEAELETLRNTLTRIELAVAEDRATVRAATGQWAAVRAANMQWPEQLSQLRTQMDRLQERVQGNHEQVRDELDGLQDDIGRLGAYTLQTQVQERMINRVEAQQARLAESLGALSRNLVDQRLRTNGVIIAGAAVAVISTTALLFANAPHFW